jgi:hypothetical protein
MEAIYLNNSRIALPVALSLPSWRMGLLPTTLNSSLDSTTFEAITISC